MKTQRVRQHIRTSKQERRRMESKKEGETNRLMLRSGDKRGKKESCPQDYRDRQRQGKKRCGNKLKDWMFVILTLFKVTLVSNNGYH